VTPVRTARAFSTMAAAAPSAICHLQNGMALRLRTSFTFTVGSTPATDLIPVCPNCHAMLHWHHGPAITIEQLRPVRVSAIDSALLRAVRPSYTRRVPMVPTRPIIPSQPFLTDAAEEWVCSWPCRLGRRQGQSCTAATMTTPLYRQAEAVR
jgi:hypothetical protein